LQVTQEQNKRREPNKIKLTEQQTIRETGVEVRSSRKTTKQTRSAQRKRTHTLLILLGTDNKTEQMTMIYRTEGC
jgi:hypothetical protein